MNERLVLRWELFPGTTKLDVPVDSEVLSVDVHRGGVHLWTLSSPMQTVPTRELIIDVFPTGVLFDATGMEFVGTVNLREDGLIFHVFIRHPQET